MPYRYTPCITGEIYHIFNRSNAEEHIFQDKREHKRFQNLLNYYRFENHSQRFSSYAKLSIENQFKYISNIQENNRERISIHAFCVLSNHYHLLLRQEIDNGISDFISHIQNAYAKYIDVKRNRIGSVFQCMYKAVRIESEEQLLHTHRYIHLNPSTSQIVKTDTELFKYPWSSLSTFIGITNYNFIHTELIASLFSSTDKYKEFISDQIEYQRMIKIQLRTPEVRS